MVELRKYRLVVVAALVEACVILGFVTGVITVAAGQSVLAGYTAGLSTTLVSIGACTALLNYAKRDAARQSPPSSPRELPVPEPGNASPDVAVWAVIAPDSALSWHPDSETERVSALCVGPYPPDSYEEGAVWGRVRYRASSV